ncbi:MAG: beta-galactosidase, partial [Armatimonadetes bacterium]|nr:beta-galactosidase [Armatimonadota bacterium]
MSDTRQVTYDAKSFIVGGRRVFLSSGAAHYFRSPRESWKDIITKAKLGGLNTIETYVAWNFHEYEERNYDFDGDRDLGRFLETIHDLGMYAIVRPGPYICAEWDFGGFPWWLATKKGIHFRTDDPIYLSYVDRWFDKLIPIIAERQFTRGGSVIAVQVENEYSIAGQDPEMAERYQGHLRDGMRARGIDVPLLTCAGGCSGTIECANAHRPSELFPELRKRQPDMPLFSTEFWAAWYDVWGQEHRTRGGRDVYNETLRIAAVGGSGYNYYMWHGGTNFGYSTSYLQTTSYDIDAPLSEAAQFTVKGYWTKLAAQFLQTVAPILTEADGPAELGQPLPEGVKAWVRRAGDSAVVFFENTGTDSVTFGFEWEPAAIPEITLRPGEMRAVTISLRVGADIVLAYSTAMPFAIVTQEERPFIFVHGTPGTR